jgi:small subunit ribosomal protein S2
MEEKKPLVKTKEESVVLEESETFFVEEKNITLEQMLEAGVHFGHRKSRWNPAMRKYIFSIKQGIHILDLEETQKGLERATNFMKQILKDGGKILFVGTKRPIKEITKLASEHCKMPCVTERWLGGTLTNFEVIKKRIDKLKNLENLQEKGELKKYTKKEQAVFKEEVEKFNKAMGGIKEMGQLPSALFVVDACHDSLAVKEAKTMNIPVIALADTNTNPKNILFPIPANDDAINSVRLILFYISSNLV